ncbi:CYTH domain-containing protein (plasmid) [Sinorhizobium meliloti]|jgi:adenylate cyclase|uniref:CYTH domain-containing protein n=1 Tax=Rhizobium meliloti TaxID=382 RepID=UPI002D78B264|nr:CYTH domain-containing protein [Sinorhizobium meliloti]WRQ71235.1 CYTH domain-containing protein [Sinorhizobium meliloti]
MKVEIERKFRILDEGWRAQASASSELRQGYIVMTKKRVVRVRTIDGAGAVLTVKIRTRSGRREEYEYVIPYDDATRMLDHALCTIDKTRHEVEYRGFRWEIDVYHAMQEGLIIAEVELSASTDEPPLPPWLGPEITGNPKYSNRVLAKKGAAAHTDFPDVGRSGERLLTTMRRDVIFRPFD